MSLDEVDLRRYRLLYINGIWKVKLPDGTIRDATGEEIVALIPKPKKDRK